MWSGMSAPSVMALLRSFISKLPIKSFVSHPQEGEVVRMPFRTNPGEASVPRLTLPSIPTAR